MATVSGVNQSGLWNGESFPVVSENFPMGNGATAQPEVAFEQYYQHQPRSTPKGPYEVVVIMLVILFSVALNLRVFFIIVTGNGVQRRRIRPVSILVAHLSSIAICYTFILLLYIVEKWSIVNLSGPGICEVLSFFRNAVYSVFPLNVVSIIYERTRSFQITLGKLLVFRTICLMWIVAAIGSWPSVFMVEYEMDLATKVGKCKQIPLFGDFGVTLAYELFRFIVYHGLVVGYMVYALFKIRSKVRYLYILKPIPNERMKKKVQRLRYVYLHSIVFILLWLPSGLVLCAQKVLTRWSFLFSSFQAHLNVKVMIFLTFTFFILSPLIYVWLHEDISLCQLCCGRDKRKGKAAGDEQTTENADEGIKKEGNNPCPGPTGETQLTSFSTRSDNNREKGFKRRRSQESSSSSKIQRKGKLRERDNIASDLNSRISTVAVTATSDNSEFHSSPRSSTSRQHNQQVVSTPPRIEVCMDSSSDEEVDATDNIRIPENVPTLENKLDSKVFREVTVQVEETTSKEILL